MLWKCLGALALALTPCATSSSVINYNANPAIVQVVCDMGGGHTGRGTAFRVSPDLLVSAAHVTGLGNCAIKGQPLTEVYQDPDLDFAIIKLHGDESSLPIDCSGFHLGQPVYAVGFARGLPVNHTMVLLGAGKTVRLSGHYAPFGLLLYGRIIPGMSGGPIFDRDTGAVVGVNNAYSPILDISFSRELKDTILCQS